MPSSQNVFEKSAFVLATTEHRPIASPGEAKVFLRALAEAPEGVRLTQRLRSDDGKTEVRLWEAPSMKLLGSYIAAKFPGGNVTGQIGIFDPPNNNPAITIAIADPTPGSGVIVGGVNFRAYKADQSQLLLVGGRNAGALGAFPAALTSRIVDNDLPAIELNNLTWGDTYASGFLPGVTLPNGSPGLTGVLDQQAYLMIVTAAGKVSNLWPVTFTAVRGGPSVIPGSAFNIDECAGGGCGDLTGGTIYGSHSGPLSPFIEGPSSGTDRYSCQLKNQFVYYDYQWVIQDGVNGGPFGPNQGPSSQTEIDLEVSWFYDFGAGVGSLYQLDVRAIGPVGLTGW